MILTEPSFESEWMRSGTVAKATEYKVALTAQRCSYYVQPKNIRNFVPDYLRGESRKLGGKKQNQLIE